MGRSQSRTRASLCLTRRHIWPYMPKGGTSESQGGPRHIYLSHHQAAILGAIAKFMGSSRTGIEPSRSQLISKAVENFIDDCREESAAKRQVIEQAEMELQREKLVSNSQKKEVRK